jgi:hypothetical protein
VHLRCQSADAGIALGSVLVARPKAAGVVADLDHLDAAGGLVDAACPQAEQLPAAQAGADLDDEVAAVEGRAPGQEAAELLRVKARRRTRPNTTSGSTGRLGARTLRTGLIGISRSPSAASRMRFRIDRQAIVRLWLALRSSSFCHRCTTCAEIAPSCRPPR